jgi:hypothetical protein
MIKTSSSEDGTCPDEVKWDMYTYTVNEHAEVCHENGNPSPLLECSAWETER